MALYIPSVSAKTEVGGAFFSVATMKSTKIQINQSTRSEYLNNQLGSAHCTILAETIEIQK
jgi:hypothetical protein